VSRYVINCTISADGNAQMIYAARANVANAAGGSAGTAVTTALTFVDEYGVGVLPAEYAVVVTPSQACFATVTNKTTSGFNVVLAPTGSGITLAGGTFDALVMA
jgi:hypothetical protein